MSYSLPSHPRSLAELCASVPVTVLEEARASIDGHPTPGHVAQLLWLCRRLRLEPWSPLIRAVAAGPRLDVRTTVRGLRAIAELAGEVKFVSPPIYVHDPEGGDLAAEVTVRRTDGVESIGVAYLDEWSTESEAWRTRPRYMLGLRAEGLALQAAMPALLGDLTLRSDGGDDAGAWSALAARERVEDARARREDLERQLVEEEDRDAGPDLVADPLGAYEPEPEPEAPPPPVEPEPEPEAPARKRGRHVGALPGEVRP